MAWVTPAQATTMQGLVATVAAECAAGTAPASAQCTGPAGLSSTSESGGPSTSVATGNGAGAQSAPPLEQMLYRFSSAATQAQINADLEALGQVIPPAAISTAGNWLTMQSRTTAPARSWSRSSSRSR